MSHCSWSKLNDMFRWLITVRVSDGGCARLWGGRCEHHAYKVWSVFNGLLVFVHAVVGLELRQFTLDALIDDKMDNSLRDAGVRGRHAPVKAPQSVHVVDAPHALEGVHPPLPTVPVTDTPSIITPVRAHSGPLWVKFPHLVSNCRRVLISQMGLVAVMAVNPGEFRRAEVQTDADTSGRRTILTVHYSKSDTATKTKGHFTRKDQTILHCWKFYLGKIQTRSINIRIISQ